MGRRPVSSCRSCPQPEPTTAAGPAGRLHRQPQGRHRRRRATARGGGCKRGGGAGAAAAMRRRGHDYVLIARAETLRRAISRRCSSDLEAALRRWAPGRDGSDMARAAMMLSAPAARPDPRLPAADLAAARAELPLSAELLGLCAEAIATPWRARAAAWLARAAAAALPSLGRQRLRPGAAARRAAHCGIAAEDPAWTSKRISSSPSRCRSRSCSASSILFAPKPHAAAAAGADKPSRAAAGAAPSAAPARPAPGMRRQPHRRRRAARRGAGRERRASRIDTPRLNGSIELDGARLDDLTLVNYRETIDPKSPEIVLLAPDGTEHPYFAEFGWVAARCRASRCRTTTRAGRSAGGTLTPGHPVELHLGQWPGPDLHAPLSPSTTNYMFTVTQTRREPRRRAGDALSLWPASRARARCRCRRTYLLHEGPIGVVNGTLQDGIKYADVECRRRQRASPSTGGWLGITDKYWMAALIPDRTKPIDGALPLRRRATRPTSIRPTITGAEQTSRPGGSVSVERPPLRRRQGSGAARPLRGRARHSALRPRDRLGLVLCLTKPIFLALDFFYQLIGNFGLAILLLTVVDQAALLPARQQILPLDEQDEEAAAGDGEAARALRRRQGAAQAGDDGALQARGRQPGGGLPADRDPDPGVLLALQGALRHHRDAPGAVLSAGSTISRRPIRPPSQSVRPAALRAAADICVPAYRRLADHHGHAPCSCSRSSTRSRPIRCRPRCSCSCR